MSEPFTKNLTLASGQVAATATEITAGSGNHAKRLNIKFCNVGGQEEELILTVSRNGATAVRIKRVVLAANEEFRIGGFPLNSSDSLLGVASNASSVDYLVSIASENAPYTEETYDADGRLKTAPYILEQLDTVVS